MRLFPSSDFPNANKPCPSVGRRGSSRSVYQSLRPLIAKSLAMRKVTETMISSTTRRGSQEEQSACRHKTMRHQQNDSHRWFHDLLDRKLTSQIIWVWCLIITKAPRPITTLDYRRLLEPPHRYYSLWRSLRIIHSRRRLLPVSFPSLTQAAYRRPTQAHYSLSHRTARAQVR